MLLKKHLTGLALAISLLTPAAIAGEESADVKIARAMMAAPASISAKAAVMDMDGTILREGSNGWTCIPGVIVVPGSKDPMCNDAVWMKWVKAAQTGTPFTTDVIGYSYMLTGDTVAVNNDDPADTEKNEGEHWVMEGPHLMLLMPTGLNMDSVSRNPSVPGPYVMWHNTPVTHVMVPLGERK